MKHILMLFAVAATLLSCTGPRLTAEQRAAKDRAIAQQVVDGVNQSRFLIDVNYMQPLRGPMRQLSSTYSLEVRGDTLVSYLPYFGQAWNVPFGGGKGLNFTAPITAMQAEQTPKGDIRVAIETRNEEDLYLYYIDIFPNGSADITVHSRERERISFTGQMRLH